ncbi:MAG: TonB-dependent receptor plug domain-containing protein [Acidobacteria bacterium]|nr:TonB-dependent receptor plug domain-containing protein [Acidobacteriota bacterium]
MELYRCSAVRKLIRLCFSLCAVCILPSLAFAQGLTGSLVGTVTDNSGAVIPGVTIEVVNTNTGATATTQSNAAGLYEFPLLRPAPYKLTATAEGFRTLERTGLEIRSTETVRADITLELGVVSEIVTVNEATPLLQTDQPTLGHVIESDTITAIPLATRNFTQILGTSPGVVGSIMNADRQGTGSDSVSVNGARRGSNNILVDGVPTSNQLNNAPDGDGTPSIEFLSEFKVLTSLYSAEYGRNQGSVINVTTRSGTNEFHGELYEFLRNTKLNARPFFFSEKRTNIQNQFGGNIGGPIIKNKTFFFYGMEYSRQRNGNGNDARFLVQVPDADERNGIFSKPLYDPLAGSLFANNTIPQSRLNPISLNIQNALIPLPNLVDPGSNNNFQAYQNLSTDLDQMTFRIDHTFTSKHSVNGRYFQSLQQDLAPFGWGPPGFGRVSNRKKHLWGVTSTHVFTPNFILSMRASGDYTSQYIEPLQKGDPRQFGLQPIDGVTYADDQSGPPRILIDNYLNFGNEANWSDFIDRYTYGPTMTWIKGSHSMKFGAEHQLALLNPQNTQTARGQWRFRGFGTGQGGAAGDPYADYLLTLPATKAFGAGDVAEIGGQLEMTSNYFSFFFVDDWKVTNRFTLNWGARYEADIQAHATNLDMVNWWPSRYKGIDGTLESTGIVQGGHDGVNRNTVQGDYDNFMPRLGISYRLNEKTVIRSGMGLYYDLRTGQVAQQAFNNPPTFTQLTGNCQQDQLCSLAVEDNWTYLNPGHIPGGVTFPTKPTDQNQIRGIERVVKTDNAWQYNLAIQRQLVQGMVAEVSYVGTKGTNLMARRNFNPLIPVNGIDAPLNSSTKLTRLYPGFGDMLVTSQNGSSTYHSFQASLKQRYKKSFFQASYTLGKTLSNGGEGSRFFTSLFVTPWNDWSRAKGPAAFDRRHRFSVVFNQELPSSFQGGVGKWVLNDWQLNGFFVTQTGNPLTVVSRNSGRGIGGSAINPNGDNLFADVNISGNLANPGSAGSNLDHYFVNGAFSDPGLYSFGNSGRGNVYGPGQWNVDFSMFKNIPLTERFKMQFRSEFFNIFNHANFANPNQDVTNTGSFGTIRDTSVNARLVQFALKLLF